MLSHTFKSLFIVLALGASTVLSQDSSNSLVSRHITEYLMPSSPQTHEFARVPNSNFVLLSQYVDSQLVKIELDPTTEEPTAYQTFPMGTNSSAGLHGVFPSTLYPGQVWLTLQTENKLLRVDPGQSLSDAPTIIQTIDIPAPGNGPHGVFEIGNNIWAGLKVASPQSKAYYAFRADISDPTDFTLYPCLESPVFINQEPSTGLIYVTQDASSSIMSIDVTSGETAQIPIPSDIGNTPVGMVTTSGDIEGVWFSLAGNPAGGNGSFGYIGSTGVPQYFQLKTPQLGTNAGLLHIADASTPAGGPALWLLSTSLISNSSADALIRVTFDADITSIAGEEYISLPTQNAKVHRVVVMGATVMVSELNTFTLAQLSYQNTVAGQWLPAQTAGNPTLPPMDD